MLNNILLITAGTAFLVAFYPLLVELLSTDRISVGAPWFNKTCVPLMAPLLVAVTIGANLRRKCDTLGAALRRGPWVMVPILPTAGRIFLWAGLADLGWASGIALDLWVTRIQSFPRRWRGLLQRHQRRKQRDRWKR